MTMRLMGCVTFAALMAAGTAFAEPGPVGKGDVGTMTPAESGRPSAILSADQCQNVWKEATREYEQDQGAVMINAQQATPYVGNFERVDANNDGKISDAEFKEGCNLGWVQAAAGSEKLNMPAEPDTMKEAQ